MRLPDRYPVEGEEPVVKPTVMPVHGAGVNLEAANADVRVGS